MKNITLDTGVEEFSFAGGGVLRFNPSDPNLYCRFLEAEEKLKALETQLQDMAKQQPEHAPVALSREADKKAKALLGWVFGTENDFDKVLNGVSLFAMAGNGQRVVTNLFNTLEAILTEGAARFAAEKAESIRADR
jgi:hypothetical protein